MLKETNSHSGHSEFRHFHTVVPEHPLHAVQVCPVSREAFLKIIPIGEIQEFLFDARDPSRNMEPIQPMLAFSSQTRCLPPLAIRLRHPTGSSNPCLVLDRSAGEWLAPASLATESGPPARP